MKFRRPSDPSPKNRRRQEPVSRRSRREGAVRRFSSFLQADGAYVDHQVRRRLSIEGLEDRRVLATFVDSAPALTLALAANESVAITADVNTYTLTLSGGTWSGTNNFSQVFGDSTTTLTVEKSAFNHVDLNNAAGASGTAVAFDDSGFNSYAASFTIGLHNSPAANALTFSGTSSFGAFNISADVDTHITVNSGAVLSTTTGDITLSANQQATPTSGNFIGINVNNGIITSTAGAITLHGKGGNSGSGNYGVDIQNGGKVRTTGVLPALLSITGTPGDGASAGILFNNGAVSSAGDVSLTGTNGSITESAANGGADVSGATVTLATTGAGNQIGIVPPVGGSGVPLKVNAASLLNASTADGFITIANTAGNLPLGVLNAGAAAIGLTAVGAITDGNNGVGAPNVTAADGAVLTTTGSNSAIGTSAHPIRTAIGAITAATHDGGIYISDSNGPGLIINSILAQQGGLTPVLNGGNQVVLKDGSGNDHIGTDNVSVAATGPILLASLQGVSTTVVAPNAVTINSTGGGIVQGTPGTNNVLARSVNLMASGSVGVSGGALGLAVESFSASTTNGGIFLAELIPGTAVSVVAGGAGNDVSVTGSGPTLGIGVIVAPDTVTLEETSGALMSGAGMNVIGQTVNLVGQTGIGSSGSPFKVTAAHLSATAKATGADIFVHDTTGLSMSATTNAGDVAIDYLGGALIFGGVLNFTASTALLTTSGGATMSFANTGGDVQLGAVKASAITASGAITASPTVDLTGGAVTLTAGAGIGAAGSPIKTNVTTLNATTTAGNIVIVQAAHPLTVNAVSQGFSDPSTHTGSDIQVTATAGDLTVGKVSALGTVTLNAGGAILAGTANPFNVVANGLAITAANGIGDSAGVLQTAVGTLAASGGAGGGVFLSNSKSLSVTSASATGGAVSITTLGDLNIGSVTAAGQAVTLSATGALNDANGPALNVTAQSATLKGSTIGSPSDPLETQVSSLTATAMIGGIYIKDLGTGTITLTATAAGQGSDIDFTSAGNIVLMAVTAKGNTVTLNAAGSITNGLASPGVNITAQTLSIVAPGGIGTSANPLEILVAQIAVADGGAPGVFMHNAGPVAITANALQAAGTGTLTFDAASITILDLGGAPVSLAPGRSLLLKTDTGPIVFLNSADTIKTSNGGTITVQAGTTPGSGGVAVLGNLTTDGGAIKVTADYNITIGLLNAGTGNVTVQSASGIILDGNGPSSINIIAGSTTLSGNGPTARQLELDEEIKIAAAAAASAEAAAEQTSADAFSSQLPIIDSKVAALTATLATDQTAADAADKAYNDAVNELNTLNLVVASLQTTDLVVDLGVDIALAVAGPAQAIPAFGDGGANAIYAVLKIAEDAIRIGLGAAQVAAAAQAFKVVELNNVDVAADILVAADNATLQAELLMQQAARASVQIAQAAAANALLASETAAVVGQQAIAARDQANVIGAPSAPLGIQISGSINVTAGPTDSYLEVVGDTALDQINATGSVTLISTGAITNGAPVGTPNILATGLTIVAANGIGTAANPLVTRVGKLNATNTNSGDIVIDNTAGTPAALQITGISNSSGGNVTIVNKGNAAAGEGITVTGPISATGAGTNIVTLDSGSPLTISANMTSPGPIVLSAAESMTPGDDLTVNPGVTIQSTGSSVTLQAADNVTVPAGSTIQASTTITITADHNHNPAETTGANVIVEGTLVAPSALIDVDPGDANNDTFTITPSVATPITVTGGAGSNTLIFNADGLPVTIFGNTITAAGRQPVTFNNFAAVNLLNPAGGGSVILDGAPGVANIMILTGTGQGAGAFTLNGGVAFSFSGVADFAFNGANLNDDSTITPFATGALPWNVAVTINGGAGTNLITYNGVSAVSESLVVQPSAPGAGQIIDNNAATGTPVAVVNYLFNTNIIVNGSSPSGAAGDTDTLTLKGTDPANPGASGLDDFFADFTAAGGRGTELVKVRDNANLASLYNLQNFSNFNTLTVDTGGGSDFFDLIAGRADGKLTLNVNGGAPAGPGDAFTTDTIEVEGSATGGDSFQVDAGASNDAGRVSVKLSSASSPTVVNFTGTENVQIVGHDGAGDDTVTLDGTGGNDVFTATNAGVGGPVGSAHVNSGPAISFQSLGGGANTALVLKGIGGNDTFNLTQVASGAIPKVAVYGNANSAAVIAGTSGGDTFNYAPSSAHAAQLTVNGAGGTVYALNGLNNVSIDGQDGGDALTYTSPNNAGTGSDLVYSPGASADAGTITGSQNAGGSLLPLAFTGLGAGSGVSFATANAASSDTLEVNGGSANDTFNVTGGGGGTVQVLKPNGGFTTDPITTPGVSHLVLHGLDGDDVFNLTGALPYVGTLLDGGNPSASDTAVLTGATGPVSVNLGDSSAIPPTDTTITGYGGTVTLTGIETANLGANGNALSANGTAHNDAITYTPGDTQAGTFTSAGLNTTFNFSQVAGAFTINGGGGAANQVNLMGSSGRDKISIREDLRTASVTDAFGNLLKAVVLGPDVQILSAFGLGGQDTFLVTPAAGTQFAPNNVDNLLVNVDGGGAGENNALVIQSAADGALAANQFVIVNRSAAANSGTVRTFTAAVQWPDINYANVQIVSPNVASPAGQPNLLLLGPDTNEANEALANSTFLGSGANLQVQHASIFANGGEVPPVPADQDYYRVIANQTGTLDFQVYFKLYDPNLLPAGGRLNLQVLDEAGNVLATASGGAATFGAEGAGGNARIRIPAVAGQSYYLHVFGANPDGTANPAVTNGYNMTIVNTAPTVPYNLELSHNNPPGDLPTTPLPPASDTGRSQLDDITKDTLPTIYLRLNDGFFLNDLPANGAPYAPPAGVIPIPFSPDAVTAGFRVAIFDGLSSDTPVGFASPVAGSPGIYRYTFTTPLSEGLHHLIARVQIIDPTEGAESGFGDRSVISLDITVDTTPPPAFFGTQASAADGLSPTSDTGVAGQPLTFVDRITSDTSPTFTGTAEANAIIRVYVDRNDNGVVDAGDVLIAQTTAAPVDGDNVFPGGAWTVKSTVNLNAPALFPLDGVRKLLVTGEDVAGNVSTPDALTIFIDSRGPTVNNVTIPGSPGYNLFADKPAAVAPTPLITSLDITFNDQPVRVGPDFVYPAVNQILATTVGNYTLVGDATGAVTITSVTFSDSTASGTPGKTVVTLHFSKPLADDRYTLYISDHITDNANNQLDGNFGGAFPSGDGKPGGSFSGRFTVDSHPELGVYSAGSVAVDLNGNFIFDPQNPDAANRDTVFTLGFASDRLFAGKFADSHGIVNGFDKLGAYGFVNGQWRWLLDLNGDGVIETSQGDLNLVEPLAIDGLPIAANFNGNAAGAAQIGLFDGTNWWFDMNGNHVIDNADATLGGKLTGNMRGLPIVGDFDGDGKADLATYANGTFFFDLAANDPGGHLTGNANRTINIQGLLPNTIGFADVQIRPVAADMDHDGVTDIGVYVPGRTAGNASNTAEWYFLISNDQNATKRVAGSVGTLNHAFDPAPLGHDLFASFGNQFGLPIVGNFDPPPDGQEVVGGWLVNLYHDVLGRDPSYDEWNTWSQYVDQGIFTPDQVAQLFLSSPEYRGGIINRLYQQYLGRGVDPSGLNYWLSVWQTNNGPEQVQAGIIGSLEYYHTAGQAHPNLSPDAAWVTALYQNILHREVDAAGLAYWVNYIQTHSKESVVIGFVTSNEYRLGLIQGWFTKYLGRGLDASGANYWLLQMQLGASQESIQIGILGSAEYRNRT